MRIEPIGSPTETTTTTQNYLRRREHLPSVRADGVTVANHVPNEVEIA